MGPFVPDLISDQLNLVVALLIGIAFGFVLEQAGFSSSRKLAGVFYGYDFTVLRVFFTAAITAMSGIILLSALGLLDTTAIYINPTWLWPAIVGGAIMGLGFVLGGYCPGTSVCAAAIGKVDAWFFVGGGIVGVFLFGELYSFYSAFYNSSSLGGIKVYDSLGIGSGWFAFLLIAVALSAFAATTMLERRINKTAPSREYRRLWHRTAAIGVAVLGIILAMLPDRKAYLIGQAAHADATVLNAVKTMSADELAFRIIDHEPKLRIVDIRSPDSFSTFALPGSRNIPVDEFFSKENDAFFSSRHTKKVIVADDDSQARAACVLLQKLGYENMAALQGGFPQFKTLILDSTNLAPTGGRWDEDVRTFRATARKDLYRMIAANKAAPQKSVKVEKKIMGGC
jgi:rhodanese-related sulfurtransferase